MVSVVHVAVGKNINSGINTITNKCVLMPDFYCLKEILTATAILEESSFYHTIVLPMGKVAG
jgi:hypothetical protein